MRGEREVFRERIRQRERMEREGIEGAREKRKKEGMIEENLVNYIVNLTV